MYVNAREKFSVESFSLVCPFFILIADFQSLLIFTCKPMTIVGTMDNYKKIHITNVWDLYMLKRIVR